MEAIMKYDIALIQKAISEAIEAGQPFANVDDGGTCNFDSCYISVPGMRESTAEKIGGASLMHGGWHGRRLQLGGTYGQGNRRTTMAEAQRAFLKNKYPQLSVGMFYMMD
jgi:hypothetical protein